MRRPLIDIQNAEKHQEILDSVCCSVLKMNERNGVRKVVGSLMADYFKKQYTLFEGDYENSSAICISGLMGNRAMQYIHQEIATIGGITLLNEVSDLGMSLFVMKNVDLYLWLMQSQFFGLDLFTHRPNIHGFFVYIGVINLKELVDEYDKISGLHESRYS